MSFRRFLSPALFGCVLIAAGCRDREITVYRAPKDPPPTLPPAAPATAALPEGHPSIGPTASGDASGAMTGTVPTIDAADLSWTAPAGWQAKPLGPMRKGSYSVPGDDGAVADLAITAFPGDTGGLFANVNRWRGQVGLPPIDQAQLDAGVEPVEVNGIKIALVDLSGTVNGQPTRLIGAIVPHNGGTWFFKLLGPEAVVAKAKPAMREFLSTLKAPAP